MSISITRAAWAAVSVLWTASALVVPARAAAEANKDLHITLTNQGFSPAVLHVSAGHRIKVLVDNTTALPAEFESAEMAAEYVIPGHTELPVFIRPLKPGSYNFFNDFDKNMAGKIIAQ